MIDEVKKELIEVAIMNSNDFEMLRHIEGVCVKRITQLEENTEIKVEAEGTVE